MEGVETAEVIQKKSDREEATSVKMTTNVRPKKKTVVKRKNPQKGQPSISAHIQPYNVVADLQQQKVNISFGQLFQISPKLRSDVGRSLRKPGTRNTKMVVQQFLDQSQHNAM